MFGRLGWAEILVIVVLVVILFGHSKVPSMMKNLADGLNIFKKELKNNTPKAEVKAVADVQTQPEKKATVKKATVKKKVVKKAPQKKVAKKK